MLLPSLRCDNPRSRLESPVENADRVYNSEKKKPDTTPREMKPTNACSSNGETVLPPPHASGIAHAAIDDLLDCVPGGRPRGRSPRDPPSSDTIDTGKPLPYFIQSGPASYYGHGMTENNRQRDQFRFAGLYGGASLVAVRHGRPGHQPAQQAHGQGPRHRSRPARQKTRH